MISIRVAETTRVLGKSQGYIGLAVRDNILEDGTPVMTTAWEPTPSELAALNAGAAVEVQIIGSAHPPIKVEVGFCPAADG